MLETPWQLCAPSAFAHDSEMDTSSWGFSFQFAFPYTMCIVPAHTTPSFNFYHHDLKQCIMNHLDNHKKNAPLAFVPCVDDCHNGYWWRQIGNTKVKFIEHFIHWHWFPTTRMRNCTLTAYGLTAWRTQSRRLKGLQLWRSPNFGPKGPQTSSLNIFSFCLISVAYVTFDMSVIQQIIYKHFWFVFVKVPCSSNVNTFFTNVFFKRKSTTIMKFWHIGRDWGNSWE